MFVIRVKWSSISVLRILEITDESEARYEMFSFLYLMMEL
jgi:hypothetical protein